MSDLEKYRHLIKTRAYFLWVQAGKPVDRDWEFWLAAEQMIREQLENVRRD
jgi:hypothetical protein